MLFRSGTRLIVSKGIGGTGIRFTAQTGTNYEDRPGTDIGDAIRARIDFTTGVSKLRFQVGDSGYADPDYNYVAYYALNFGTQVPFFKPPLTYGIKANNVVVAECGNTNLITVCLVAPESFVLDSDVTVDLLDLNTGAPPTDLVALDRKSTRLNSSHSSVSRMPSSA